MRNRQARTAYREHNRRTGMLGHLLAVSNMMVSLSFHWTYNIHYQPCILTTLYNNWPYFGCSVLLIIKTAETDCMHCFILHSYYQRNLLFILVVKDFITSAVLASRLTLISPCRFNQVPKTTSSLLPPWTDCTGRHMLSLSAANRSAVL